MATSTPRVPREILEDRYLGLTRQLASDGDDLEYADLGGHLLDVLTSLASETGRCHGDDVGHIVGDLMKIIRVTIIERIAAEDLADPAPWRQLRS